MPGKFLLQQRLLYLLGVKHMLMTIADSLYRNLIKQLKKMGLKLMTGSESHAKVFGITSTVLIQRRCALVIVDLQKGCGESWPKDISAVDPVLGRTFADRMNEIVIPNVSRLLEFFRQNDMLIIYTTIGDDSIMARISPSRQRMDKNREFVIQKFSDGAFPTSPIDNILREHGVATVFFVGTDTACCVNATINEAQDRSYQCILIEDGCVSSRSELHEAAVKIWAYRAFVRTTDQVINDYPWQKWVYPNN
jgi:biuret amidohydrolase